MDIFVRVSVKHDKNMLFQMNCHSIGSWYACYVTACMLTLVNVMALSLENGSNFRAILRVDELLNMDTNDINLGRGRGRERERGRRGD